MNKKVMLILFTISLCAGSLAAQVTGDVNVDNSIDIIDALLTAQYYVGLNPSPYNKAIADVDVDGAIDIIDALMIAQYYVGLVSVLPAALVIPHIDEQYMVVRIPVIDLGTVER